MADVRPFRGIHYSGSVVRDWSAVICPPHDIISPQLQEKLYQSSEYNFVRLEYGKELPGDTVTDNKYTRAALTLAQWLAQGVLETDKAPAIYLHDHLFTLEGKEYKRRSIIARVRLEEWDKKVIFPHEATMAVTRSDRLSLLWALQANTSPILTMFEDRQQQIYAQLARHAQRLPLISSRIVDGEGHILWAITDAGAVNQISKSLAEQTLYIADGHHRYESALAYQAERKNSSKSKDAAANFVMMELVDFAHTGLKILAPHRLVSGISVEALHNLAGKLSEYFEVVKVPLSVTGLREQVNAFLGESDGVRLAVFGPDIDSLLELKLKDPAVSGLMPGSHSELYKKLDVSIVDHIILERVLGMSRPEKPGLAYNHDLLDAVNRVKSGDCQLAILLSPVKPETIKAVADAGDRMPAKSTYFYPKAPAGLVLHRLV
ncbi:MAG: DUF1015 domain-containing protein [Chloroflexi bacterium]|nr:DUF1015 domain-containing protein [Chloroflexota bacterium]